MSIQDPLHKTLPWNIQEPSVLRLLIQKAYDRRASVLENVLTEKHMKSLTDLMFLLYRISFAEVKSLIPL